jgi:hypothetical protein
MYEWYDEWHEEFLLEARIATLGDESLSAEYKEKPSIIIEEEEEDFPQDFPDPWEIKI